jgi:magnesium transporter
MAALEEEEKTTLENQAAVFDPETVPATIALGQNNSEWENHILDLISARNTDDILPVIKDLYIPDLALLIERAQFDDAEYLYDQLDPETQGLVLVELELPLRQRLMRNHSPKEMAEILREQESTEAAELLSDMKTAEVSELLSHMHPDDRINVTELLSYPENSAGSMMAKEFVAVQEKSTVKQAISTIRKISKETDDIYTVFVIDNEGIYKGHISLARLILANPVTAVTKIMEQELLPIPVHTDREEVARFFTRYDFITVPVVNNQGVMLGRITVDDILEVVQEEASEDILRMGGVGESETLQTPVYQASLRRIIWLTVNLATAFLAASVVRLFEGTISQAVVLAALMPIVAGMGGNAAGQTMAVVIRNIALGEIGPHNQGKVLRREISLGLLNGMSLGGFTGIVVFLITQIPVLGYIIGFAMFSNMFIAASAGTLIPLTLKRFGIDPAIASTIFVTTATDVLGFLSFLGLASMTLPYLKG